MLLLTSTMVDSVTLATMKVMSWLSCWTLGEVEESALGQVQLELGGQGWVGRAGWTGLVGRAGHLLKLAMSDTGRKPSGVILRRRKKSLWRLSEEK